LNLFFYWCTRQAITSLSISNSGTTLVSGSLDNTAKLWDVHSRQAIKTLTHKGPVSNVVISLQQRLFLEKTTRKLPQSIQPFKKFTDTQLETSIPIKLNTNEVKYDKNTTYDDKNNLLPYNVIQDNSQLEISSLRLKLAQMQEDNTKWKNINNELYQFSINELLQKK